MGSGKLKNGKMKMTMGSHLKNNGCSKDANTIGIRKTSVEEYEKELIDIKSRLNVLITLPQQN